MSRPDRAPFAAQLEGTRPTAMTVFENAGQLRKAIRQERKRRNAGFKELIQQATKPKALPLILLLLLALSGCGFSLCDAAPGIELCRPCR